ncbi:MAG TPA: hypothetical protein VJ983_07910, partial [candidate division Zixibacteria bacterium]|nr:hypothetical protein [candidate division Zixibacteria bacterium]
LYLSADSEFTTSFVYDSLSDTSYQATDSLFMGVKYWWKVAATDRAALTTQSAPRNFWTWLSGDLNNDHAVDISDVIIMVDFMFNDGNDIQPHLRGDVDGNCALDIADLVYLVEFAFSDGPAPVIGCAQ